MRIRARDFFSREQKERIRQAVQAAEEMTTGEIAVMLVDESDRYREAELAGALSFSTLGALVLAFALRHTSIWFYIPVAAILLLPFLFLFRQWPHMKLAFLRPRRVEEAVRERAVYAFFQKGVHRTEEETGILIFISLLERKVWIIGDRGIHGKIGSDFWKALAGELATGLRENRAIEVLCGVISKCGAELARHFPGRPGADHPGQELICE